MIRFPRTSIKMKNAFYSRLCLLNLLFFVIRLFARKNRSIFPQRQFSWNFTFLSLAYADVHRPASVSSLIPTCALYNPSWVLAWELACIRVASIWVNFSMNAPEFANRACVQLRPYMPIHFFQTNVMVMSWKFKYCTTGLIPFLILIGEY